MKRTIVILQLMLLSVICVSAQTWNLTSTMTATLENGVLTIYTTLNEESMSSSEWEGPPWFDIRGEIREVIIKKGITSVGNDTFFGCYNLTTVTLPEGITYIGSNSFFQCGFESITIPSSVTFIGVFAFDYCSRLTEIWVDEENSFYSSDETGVLYDKNKTKLVKYPPGKNGEFTIPETVTDISAAAFRTSFGLTSVTMPQSVTHIGDLAFDQCSNLTAMTIPKSVYAIGDDVFNACTKLSDITVGWARPFSPRKDIFPNVNTSAITLHIPAGTKELYKTADFWKDFGTIIDDGKLASALTLQLTPTMMAILDENGVLTISTSLDKETMPDYITDNMYASAPWFGFRVFITEVIIDSGVTSIGNWAFYDCSGITSVTIPASVTAINHSAFSGCSGLTDIAVEWAEPLNISSDVFNGTNPLNVTLHVPNVTEALYRAHPVWGSFFSEIMTWNLTPTMTATFIQNGLLTISTTQEAEAMPNYNSNSVPWTVRESIKKISIESGVTTIGDWAFYKCSGLASVIIPKNVTSIGERAFCECANITSVIISEGVTTIGDYAFQGCNKLNSVSIPGSIAAIGYGMFSSCSNLSNITISEGVTSIGEDAFAYCGFTSITIPQSITSIGNGAFYRCSNLASITIPQSITSIGSQAFRNCNSLRDFMVEWATPLPVPSDMFIEGNQSAITLHVPVGTRALYEVAEVWRDFGKIVEYTPTGLSELSVETFVYMSNDDLHIQSPVAEIIQVYSINGMLLHCFSKQEGKFVYHINQPKGKMLIVKGGSGWSKKLIMQ